VKINLFDTAFIHIDQKNHGITGIKPTFFEWDRSSHVSLNKLAIFTEDYIYASGINTLTTKLNIGWLIESRELAPSRYENFDKINKSIDFVMTHDKELLEKYPNKTKFMPFGGCWIDAQNHELIKKTKLCSTIFSNKTFMSGHKVRHHIYHKFNNSVIDFYGAGCNKKIDKKDIAIKDYAYHIVVENSYTENYFTEKLLDCFAYGTIPIYYGCPNIDDFFNTDGIIKFNNYEELNDILNKLSLDDKICKQAVAENLELLKKYMIPENYMYEHILKDL